MKGSRKTFNLMEQGEKTMGGVSGNSLQYRTGITRAMNNRERLFEAGKINGLCERPGKQLCLCFIVKRE